MSCGKAVRETLSKLDNVDKVEVDFEKKTATVTMKEKGSITKDIVETSFKGSKFGVTSFDKQEKKKETAQLAKAYKLSISGMT